jgi:hypothetical protein
MSFDFSILPIGVCPEPSNRPPRVTHKDRNERKEKIQGNREFKMQLIIMREMEEKNEVVRTKKMLYEYEHDVIPFMLDKSIYLSDKMTSASDIIARYVDHTIKYKPHHLDFESWVYFNVISPIIGESLCEFCERFKNRPVIKTTATSFLSSFMLMELTSIINSYL